MTFSNALTGWLQDQRLTKVEAARLLGVSRQMLYAYLKGARPGLNVELRAKRLGVQGIMLPEQLALPFLQKLTKEDLEISEMRKFADRVEFEVTIRFGS